MGLTVTAATRTLHGRSITSCLQAQSATKPGSSSPQSTSIPERSPSISEPSDNPQIIRMADFVKPKSNGA